MILPPAVMGPLSVQPDPGKNRGWEWSEESVRERVV